VLARKRFPGQANSLDALCKRFNISLNTRQLHGALVDARLLAEVYLELRGGRERSLAFEEPPAAGAPEAIIRQAARAPAKRRPTPLPVLSTAEERAAHAAFIAALGAPTLWLKVEREALEAAKVA
jgi:DNA polymerase-3 subunit epsilon